MISDLFITRTRLAIVTSIIISIAGAIAVFSLPIQQYPQITPPTVTVSASYPGASAEVIADVVGGPLETAINGVDHMMYMSSTSSNAGQYTLSVTFEVGTDPETAQINVQNRAQLAISRLPAAVAQQGVSVRARSPDFVLGIAFYSPDDSLDALAITNFITTTVADAISRVPGVGEASVAGASEYSMRVWLNPQRMDALGLTPDDVSAAIQRQNIQLCFERQLCRARVGDDAGQPVSRRQRHPDRNGGPRRTRAPFAALPQRHAVSHRLRCDPLRECQHLADDQNPA
jgi:HAE1 family hydrophobic/amphiphilic exporter-1